MLRKLIRDATCWRLLAFVGLTFSVSCTSMPTYFDCEDVEISGKKYCSVSFADLLGNPGALHGVYIAIRGYFAIEDGIAYLLPSIEDLRTENDLVAVMLDIPLGFLDRSISQGSSVEVYGQFEWHPEMRNPYRRQLVDIYAGALDPTDDR